MAGIFLSTIGILCLSLPRTSHSPPVSKTPGRISLGLLVIGAWGVFVLMKYHRSLGTQAALGVAILSGIPAMIFGLSGRSGRLGKFVAAISWCGMLGLFLANFLPDYGRYYNFGWTNIQIPAAEGMAVAAPREKPQNMEREERINAVKSWLELIDAGKYVDAWDRTSTLTRTLESESGWIDKVKHFRDPFGQTITRKIYGTKETVELPGAPEGLYYIFTFHSDFATKSNAVETVTLIYQDDGNWRVLGYSIQ